MIVLGERPQILDGAAEQQNGDAGSRASALRFNDGRVEESDLIVPRRGPDSGDGFADLTI